MERVITPSRDGVRPEAKKPEAISNFPIPQDIHELRSFLGLVNQLGVILPDLAHATETLRSLLKKNVAYLWLTEHQQCFEDIKSLVLSPMVIQPFDQGITRYPKKNALLYLRYFFRSNAFFFKITR